MGPATCSGSTPADRVARSGESMNGYPGPCSEHRCAVADAPFADAAALAGAPLLARCLECGLAGRGEAALLRHCDARGHRSFAQHTGHGVLLHCRQCSRTTYAGAAAEAGTSSGLRGCITDSRRAGQERTWNSEPRGDLLHVLGPAAAPLERTSPAVRPRAPGSEMQRGAGGGTATQPRQHRRPELHRLRALLTAVQQTRRAAGPNGPALHSLASVPSTREPPAAGRARVPRCASGGIRRTRDRQPPNVSGVRPSAAATEFPLRRVANQRSDLHRLRAQVCLLALLR